MFPSCGDGRDLYDGSDNGSDIWCYEESINVEEYVLNMTI